ncbi:DUF421 domain-containing protein [Desmospora activa]|uniref:Uncharacterized membrane protein YcaP (DUF421 family) n=1 Tax=Desmospora activa DSM 45169 TaxID=1121389 RepID=A0A2T4Z7C3_9BACL|nr:DUF421 domain-containing protein [Desmospora activa]PTM57765.1 uncharacterized membrane protein YcaP (DUF421 family) [Desmospora activa DSM 45169]
MEYLQILLQTVIAFATILVITMILGKQQIAEMTYFEYVNGITFGSIAGTLATDLDHSMGYHWVGLVAFGVLTFTMSYLAMKSRKARKWLEGEPLVVISGGKVMEDNMRKTRFTMGEIMQLLRKKEVFDLSQVQFGILENDGSLSVLMKPDYQPTTPKNIFQPSNVPQLPIELVIDGQIIQDGLQKLGQSEQWLLEQIQKQKSVHSIEEVFYARMETDGKLKVDLRDDGKKKH